MRLMGVVMHVHELEVPQSEFHTGFRVGRGGGHGGSRMIVVRESTLTHV